MASSSLAKADNVEIHSSKRQMNMTNDKDIRQLTKQDEFVLPVAAHQTWICSLLRAPSSTFRISNSSAPPLSVPDSAAEEEEVDGWSERAEEDRGPDEGGDTRVGCPIVVVKKAKKKKKRLHCRPMKSLRGLKPASQPLSGYFCVLMSVV